MAPLWYRGTTVVARRFVSRARAARAPRDPVAPTPVVSTGTDQTDYSSNALLEEWSVEDGAAGSDDGKEHSRPSRSEGEGRGMMARTDSIEKLRKLLKRRATAYISQREAMREFLVSENELCELDYIERGNPYDESAPTVRHFSRQDVILKAIERWGSLRAMELEKERQVIAKRARIMRKRASRAQSSAAPGSAESAKLLDSTSVVNTALVGNLVLSFVKIGAFFVTGAGAMLSEGIHSLCDFSNQYLLRVGAGRSTKAPDARFPYGYSPDRYIFGLMSGVGIFFLGCGVTTYHGISLLLNPHVLDTETLKVALGALGISGVVESCVVPPLLFFRCPPPPPPPRSRRRASLGLTLALPRLDRGSRPRRWRQVHPTRRGLTGARRRDGFEDGLLAVR